MQQLFRLKVSTTQLFLQDEILNLDDLTEFDDASVFKLENLPILSYEKDYFTQMDITIEMNLNQKVIARQGYTVLDFISDLGGMQGMLISFIGWFIAIWNYNMFDNHMVSRLFKVKKRDPEDQVEVQTSDFMEPDYFFNIKEYLAEHVLC